MEKSISCFAHKLLDAGLNAGHSSGVGSNLTGGDLFELLPYMVIPMLVVLIGGLYLINFYRKRRLSK